MALELRIGDIVRMKKSHPCGNSFWEVTRLGADIGLICQQCRRYVMLPRTYLNRRVKEVFSADRSNRDITPPGNSESAPG